MPPERPPGRSTRSRTATTPEFVDAYEDDALWARAIYECLPTAGKYTFFRNALAVRKALSQLSLLDDDQLAKVPATPTVGIEYYYGQDLRERGGPGRTDETEEPPDGFERPDTWHVKLDLDALKKHNFPLAIHMDLGITHDKAGVAASHIEGVVTRFGPHRGSQDRPDHLPGDYAGLLSSPTS